MTKVVATLLRRHSCFVLLLSFVIRALEFYQRPAPNAAWVAL
jgi:hypothetical protein